MNEDNCSNKDSVQAQIQELREYLQDLQTLVRVNNLLLSRFILQLSKVRQDLHLPKREVFFKFELLEDDYKLLVNEYGKEETDKALYRLDRLLLQNKQQCPHNIRKYIHKKLKRSQQKRNESRKETK